MLTTLFKLKKQNGELSNGIRASKSGIISKNIKYKINLMVIFKNPYYDPMSNRYQIGTISNISVNPNNGQIEYTINTIHGTSIHHFAENNIICIFSPKTIKGS